MRAVLLTLLADHATSDELAHMAAAKRLTENPRTRLSAEAVEEFADLLEAGRRPALGWWQRHLPPPAFDPVVHAREVERFASKEAA